MTGLKPPKAKNWKHGACCRDKKLYSVWRTMLHRCNDPKRVKYRDYGGRGIAVCEEWKDANVFMDWAFENGYKTGLQLDRIDNNGNYHPENCRFVTPKENSRNRRNTKRLTINGETKTVVEWCEQLGVNQYTVYDWIRKKGVAYAEQRISGIA